MNTKLLLSLFFTFTMLNAYSCQYACTEKDRNADCTNVKQEKTCGLYDQTVRCIKFPCGIDGNNQCELCKQANIEKVVFSTCAEYENQNTSGQTSSGSTGTDGTTSISREACTAEDKAKTASDCSAIKSSVHCGYFETDGSQEYENRCYACIDSKVTFTINTKCDSIAPTPVDEEVYICKADERGKTCPENFIGDGYCGHFETCTSDSSCSMVYGSQCLACSDLKVSKVIKGKCPQSLPISKPQQTMKCSEEERKSTNTCDGVVDEVCGRPGNCLPGDILCNKTYNNKCEACKQGNIDYVEPGKCINETTYSDCSSNSRNMMCPMLYQGVCAIRDKSKCDNSKENDCYFNSGTECQACSDPSVVGVYNKECYHIFHPEIATSGLAITSLPPSIAEKDKTYCTESDRNAACTKEYRGVCAYYFKDKQQNNKSFYTEATKCTACSNSNIEYIVDGVCPQNKATMQLEMSKSLSVNDQAGGTDQNQTTPETDPSYRVIAEHCTQRADICTEEYKPVCGFKKCPSGLCPFEASNACKACSDQNVIFKVNRTCNNVTLKNLIIPCTDEERKKTCSSDSPLYNLNVCGEYSKNSKLCLDSTCSKDYSNSCDACTIQDVENFRPSECSGYFILALNAILILSVFLY